MFLAMCKRISAVWFYKNNFPAVSDNSSFNVEFN